MTSRLEQLLEEQAPRPRRPLDLDAAWREGRRRRHRRRVGAGAAVAAAVVVGGLVAGLAAVPGPPTQVLASGSAVAPPDGPLHVLQRPARAGDRLPGWAAAEPGAGQLGDPARARLASSAEGRDYYVTAVDGRLCLAEVEAGRAGLRATCAAEAMVAARRGVLPLELVDDRRWTWAALVPNGFAEAQVRGAVVPVSDNVAVFPRLPRGATEVLLRGPAGEQVVPLWVEVPPRGGDPVPPPLVEPTSAERLLELEVFGDGRTQGRFTCSPVAELRPDELEVLAAEHGYRLSWRWEEPRGGAAGYSSVRSAPPVGRLTGVAPLDDGVVAAFVAAGDPAPEPGC